MQDNNRQQFQTQRDNELDIYRGCSMIYITCFLHNFYGVQCIDTVATSMLLITMPIVFFISGASYTLASSKPYLQYVWRRVKRIVFPYYICVVIVTALYFLYECIIKGESGVTFANNFIAQGYYNIFSGKLYDFNHLWFIPPYLAVALLLPLLNKIKPHLSQWGIYALALLTVVVLAIYPNEIWCYAAFAFIGLYYKQHFPANRYVIAVMMACAMMWCVWQGYSLNMQANKFPPNIMFFSYCGVVVALFLPLMGILCRWVYRSRFFRYYIDRYARMGLTVYLYHGINVHLLQKLLIIIVGERDLPPIGHLSILIATSIVLFFGNIYLSMLMKQVENSILRAVGIIKRD